MNRFLAAEYKPTESDVVVQYSVLPLRKESFHECLHQIVDGLQYGRDGADASLKIFELNQESFQCKIAFPEALFEIKNLPQNLSVIAGSIFDTPSETSIKILNITWSEKLLKAFPGPSNGIPAIREELNIFDRPILSGLLLPKYPLSTKEYLEKAYLMWMGGCDLVEENEIMTSQSFHAFQERVEFIAKERTSCSERTKKIKCYIPNITAGTVEEMNQRAGLVKSMGLHFASVNATTIGLAALNSLIKTCQELNLSISGHQNGVGLWTKNPQSGWSLPSFTTLQKQLGLDLIHVEHHSPDLNATIASLTGSDRHFKSAFPIYGGNVHPGDIEDIIKTHGHELVIRAEKWMHSHPDGIKAGAEAFLFALESATQGIEAESAMKKNEPFRRALESWKQMETTY
jgi:ribulose-bisphosphate carboxylase large chain